MTVMGRIEINRGVMLGKPVIRGTRMAVELILRKWGDGTSEADFLDAYPSKWPLAPATVLVRWE